MVDVNLCKGCDYSAEFLDTVCCDYIGIVHRARPKSGAGQCTVFTPKTDRPRTVDPYTETDITYGSCEPWHKENPNELPRNPVRPMRIRGKDEITHEGLDACFYILRTGKRRPCPGGDKCTVFKKKAKENRTVWVDY